MGGMEGEGEQRFKQKLFSRPGWDLTINLSDTSKPDMTILAPHVTLLFWSPLREKHHMRVLARSLSWSPLREKHQCVYWREASLNTPSTHRTNSDDFNGLSTFSWPSLFCDRLGGRFSVGVMDISDFIRIGGGNCLTLGPRYAMTVCYSSPMASLVLTDSSQLTALKIYQTKL
uniref:Uncharacterized protein n=1 Tax=Timema tahoe TaxID=61484 RepID=A0A7R9NZ28_9NEOP|nr:unnamed protein product [Timema tahoe]